MKKSERLKQVLSTITLLGKDDGNFSELEKLRKEQYILEGRETFERKMVSYGFNLRATGDEPFKEYRVTKRRKSKRGAFVEFEEHVRNYKQDVTEQLNKLEYQLRQKGSKNS